MNEERATAHAYDSFQFRLNSMHTYSFFFQHQRNELYLISYFASLEKKRAKRRENRDKIDSENKFEMA